MDGKVFTFWEGQMPGYIQLCMKTWQFDYVLLNYSNLHEYTNLKLTDRLRSFSLPKIADVIRVHVLRNYGGYWLDTDTIMISDELPKSNFMGYPDTREHTIGFLHTEPHADMYRAWAKYQTDNLGYKGFRSVYTNALKKDLWPQRMLERWIALTDQAKTEILPYKSTNPELYKQLSNHIGIESLAFRYLLVSLYSDSYDPAYLLTVKKTFASDILTAGLTLVSSMSGQSISSLLQSWGVS
jgi:hypothetical protein